MKGESNLKKTFVSLVIPLTNNEQSVQELVETVSEGLAGGYANYEVLLVDNGSTDATVSLIVPLLKKYKSIRVIRLLRTYNVETALFAGLENSIGDYVVTFLPDIDPVDQVPVLLRKIAKNQADIIHAIPSKKVKGSMVTRIGRKIFYWYSRRFLRITFSEGTTYFSAFNRRAVNALVSLKQKNRSLRIMSSLIGFKTETFVYETSEHRPKVGFFQSVSLALDIAINYSNNPLRLASWLGIIAASLNALYVLYIVAVYLFKSQVTEGWTTLSLQAAGMFFVIFFILIIISEYLGRILEELGNQPSYYVMEELVSEIKVSNGNMPNVELS